MSFDQLAEEVMKLGIDEKDGLWAEKLLLSVDDPSDAENLGLWVAEAERRLQELRDGAAEEIPVEEVFRRATAAIS